jgi:hypothetical protein
MARWELHPEALNEVRTEPLLRDLAEDVAADARRLAKRGETGNLKESIGVAGVYSNAAYVSANPRNPHDPPGEDAYAFYVEKGTSHSGAQPFLRPALYRYRS